MYLYTNCSLLRLKQKTYVSLVNPHPHFAELGNVIYSHSMCISTSQLPGGEVVDCVSADPSAELPRFGRLVALPGCMSAAFLFRTSTESAGAFSRCLLASLGSGGS